MAEVLKLKRSDAYAYAPKGKKSYNDQHKCSRQMWQCKKKRCKENRTHWTTPILFQRCKEHKDALDNAQMLYQNALYTNACKTHGYNTECTHLNDTQRTQSTGQKKRPKSFRTRLIDHLKRRLKCRLVRNKNAQHQIKNAPK